MGILSKTIDNYYDANADVVVREECVILFKHIRLYESVSITSRKDMIELYQIKKTKKKKKIGFIISKKTKKN